MLAIKKKLFLAAFSVILAITLMVSASLAWFSVSTAPEISGMQISLFTDRALLLSLDNTAFQQYISLSECFAHLTPLRPVSTVDGLNWFIPTYESSTGQLRDPQDFILDTKLKYANVSTLGTIIDEQTGEKLELTGAALRERSNEGYYVYAEFWLKTEEENGCRVRLTVPAQSVTDSAELETGVYGSYVLGTYELETVTDEETGEETTRLKSSGKLAENAMRIGFLVNPTQKLDPEQGEMVDDPDYSSEYAGDVFYIYEPNAEGRSSDNKPLYRDDNDEVNYVVGYEFNVTNYVAGNYFETKPIGITKTTTTDDQGTETEKTVIGPVALDPSRLIIQKASRWNMESLGACLAGGKTPNSNQVQYPMGGFVDSETVYESLPGGTAESFTDIQDMTEDIAGSGVIVSLKEDKPVKVRLFIWLEGQDVDCWNDIAAGGFFVNLELAGESIISEN